jgi:hypothetical protein
MQLFLFFFFGVSMNRLIALKKNLMRVVNEQKAKVNAFLNRVTAALILGVGMEWVGGCGCGSGCQYGCRCRCGCGYGCVVVSLDMSNHVNLTPTPLINVFPCLESFDFNIKENDVEIIIPFLLKYYSEKNDRLHLLGLQNLHSEMLHKLKQIIDQEKLFDGTYFE